MTALLVLIAACTTWARLTAVSIDDYSRYQNRVFACVRAVDGDTIEVDAPDGHSAHTRVRLWGVDAPDTARADPVAIYFGREASAFMKSLAEQHLTRLVLAPQQTRDRDGRLLAYVYVESGAREMMLNDEIIAHGLGYADRRFDHPWRLRFEQLQDRARKQGLGLWHEVRTQPTPHR